MDLNAETLGVLSGMVTSVLSSAVGYGVLRSKVDRLEKDMELHSQKYVSNELFQATIGPLKDDLHEMKADLKELLRMTKNE